MTKKDIRQQMRELNKKIQAQPIQTREERDVFHQMQVAYNNLAEKFWAVAFHQN